LLRGGTARCAPSEDRPREATAKRDVVGLVHVQLFMSPLAQVPWSDLTSYFDGAELDHSFTLQDYIKSFINTNTYGA
jgi:hypothetical protein